MEASAIAFKACTLLIPYIKAALESFAGETGKEIFKKTTQLFGVLKAQFSGKKNQLTLLKNFEDEPEQFKAQMVEMIASELLVDKEFCKSMTKIIREVSDIAPNIYVSMEVADAKSAIGVEAETFNRGTLTVEQKIEKTKKVTGAKIGKIG